MNGSLIQREEAMQMIFAKGNEALDGGSLSKKPRHKGAVGNEWVLNTLQSMHNGHDAAVWRKRPSKKLLAQKT